MSDTGSGQSAEAVVARVQQALEADGVFIGAGARGVLDAGDLAALRAASAASDQPIYVVVRQYRPDDAFNGNAGDLLARVHDASGEPGIYLGNDFTLSGAAVSVEVRQWQDLDAPGGPTAGINGNDAYVVGRAAAPGDLGAQLVVVAQEIADETLAETADQVEAAEYGYAPSSDDGATLGFVVLGAVLLVLVLAVVAVVRVLRRRGAGSPQAFALPSAVAERVREADDVNLRRTADREVLELGEDLDRATMRPGPGQEAWRAALDHYAAARRLLDGVDAVAEEDRSDVSAAGRLDVVGAIVLGRRGRAALHQALAGARWSAVRPCLLHPLHGDATTTDALELDGATVSAPLCAACHEDLDRGGRPDLLVVHDGRSSRSYLETDVQPWVATGFGALDLDLVTALHRRRPG